MRRLLLICCLLVPAVYCCAQTGSLKFTTYAERVKFIDGLTKDDSGKEMRPTPDTLEQLRQRALAGGDEELAMELLLTKTVFALDRNLLRPEPAELTIRDIAYYAEKNEKIFLRADVAQLLGYVYWYRMGRQYAGMEEYINAYQRYRNYSYKDFPRKDIYLAQLGGAFYYFDGYRQALPYFMEAKNILEQTDQAAIHPSTYNTIGLIYRKLKKYDSAIYYFNLAYKYALKNRFAAHRGIALGNIGITYFLQGKYDDAIPLLKNDIETSLKTSQFKNAAISATTLATIYNYQHNYDEAKNLLDEIRIYGRGRDFWNEYSVKEPIYKQLSIIYAAKKDFQTAYLYSDSSMMAKDSANVLSNAATLAKVNDKLEYTERKLESEKLQNQINIQRIEINKSKLLMIVAISGAGILIIVLVFIAQLYNKIKNQKQELEQLNAVKDRIFSIISHDLRSPLNSLVSFTQLLEQGELPQEKLQRYTGALKGNLGYTASLMENLLNWARTQMQGYKPVMEQFDLSEPAAQTVGLLMPEIYKKEIRLVNNVQQGTVVNADFNMVSLLIRNLLSNAIKYTPAGGTITLSALKQDSRIRIMVQDSGVGISRRLVEEFNDNRRYQPLNSTPGTEKEKGTGLGLMLCKGFAGLMDGTLELESEVGKGSCFTVELPA